MSNGEEPPIEEEPVPLVFPTSVHYNDTADIWTLSYYGGEDEAISVVDPELPPGDFSVICQVLTLPTVPTAEVGLMLVRETAEPFYFTARSGGPGPVPVWLMIEWVDNWYRCLTSADGVIWELVEGGPVERPVQVGLVLHYEDPLSQVSVQVAHFTVLDGLLSAEPVVTAAAPAVSPMSFSPMVMSYAEPTLHVVIGSQFGDLDFDVGKSVRWVMYFTDRHFVLDVNLGDTRYYVVNWAITFPAALHKVTGINYFVNPVGFRKEQFVQADKAWHFGDEDWVLFVDASEGFSVDNRTLPDDWAMDPFKSYLYREVQRAVDAAKDWVSIPFFAFVKHDDVANVGYPIGPVDPYTGDPVFTASQPIAVPYYIPAQGLRRLIKVSALRNPAFDWTKLDQPHAPDAGVKAQILSYAYAHWNLQDIVPPATEVEDLTEANDDGWRMRKLISQVRPITGLPHDIAWNPAADAPGLPGPTADDASYNQVDITVPRPPSTSDPACVGITVPLYDQVLRLNLRDGVWYEGEVLGNLPLQWNEADEVWEPSYPPEDWHPDNFQTVNQ